MDLQKLKRLLKSKRGIRRSHEEKAGTALALCDSDFKHINTLI